MSSPRGLSAEEQAVWERLASTVEPLTGTRSASAVPLDPAPRREAPTAEVRASRVSPRSQPPHTSPKDDRTGLDSHWERRLARPSTEPDFTLDLHGHTLDQAYRRLDSGLTQAKAMGARLVLVVTGKPRPVDAADRGSKRGAIRAKILDWLAAGSHSSDIAAIRKAHRRHGGEGALYLVLKRRR
ncbi:Smr/MutS family protein [Aurantiacibacter aquimixticola]|uniref:DNA mismatch repair protein MutS n=1 Tax=Aurantiacibacter aquimixticola TaxID=1958945 RepID=A0A419RU29_9SPHN|nr:Smr/MutS family protein [Aurantiacibacter aquimixticola]RJY09254.1 DNA mismatch repair protein MutS [Aurantiacibacter aquimixticola]